MKDPHVYLEQVALKSLGFDPGTLDGDSGPKTKSAFDAWQKSLQKAVTVSPVGTIAARIVSIAANEIGIRETSKNQGPGLAKYWTATSYGDGYTDRQPYCAAFVCWVVKQAVSDLSHDYSLPTSALAYDFEKWGKANSGKGVSIVAGKVKPGDIFTLSAISHVGLISRVIDEDTVETIEGNTDGSGSREGDGVYKRTRKISGFRKVIRIG